MPKLMLFVPCEKLIVDEDGKNTTLICVIQNIEASVPKDKPVDKTATAPREWDVVTLWHSEEAEEIGTKFRQRFEFVLPDGTVLMSSTVEF